MQLPVQSGVVVRDGAFATSYPVNLEPRLVESGLSKGQLVMTRGADTRADAPDTDRGAFIYQEKQYRVMGERLYEVKDNGATIDIGSVGQNGIPARFAESFDRLAVASAEKLWYYFNGALTRVTDPDLGKVLDVDFLDGYFVTTDGEFIVITELLDPTQIDALKYGSAEDDPDAVTGVQALNGELYAFGRYTIQVLRNVGSTGFPFATVPGATVPYGCISAHAKCRVADTMAFVGGARGEPLGVFVLAGGRAVRVSTETIEDMLREAAEASITLEARRFGDEQVLIVHTDKRSFALALGASGSLDGAAWTILNTGRGRVYRPRSAVFWRGNHWVGDICGQSIGVLSETTDTHFGEAVEWRFDAALMFSEGLGFIIHQVELHGVLPRKEATVFVSMTRNGEIWSNEIGRRLTGRRDERLAWRPNARVDRMAGFRFRGNERISVSRADVQGEALGV